MTVVAQGVKVQIPVWVRSLATFRRWLMSGDMPEKPPIHFINGEVWVDPMSERAISHNNVKMEVGEVVRPIARELGGIFFGDGMSFDSKTGEFTTVPDGMFVSAEARLTGRVRLKGGKKSEQDTVVTGIPDMVLEVVSTGSVDKDTEWLMAGYANAGVPEYWIIDARGERLKFDIFKLGSRGYAAVRPVDGWRKSTSFQRSFRFVAGERIFDQIDWRLETK